MKRLIVLLAVAGLGGCAAYVPYGAADPYYGSPYYGSPYYGVQPGASVFIYGNSGYSGGRGYYRNRDRDGDGVPNWRDAHPYDPRRH